MPDFPSLTASIHGRRAALAAGALVFFLVRFLVVWGAVDHIHNVDRSEYQLAEYAHNILAGKALEYPELTHLWGHRGFATALIPFVIAAPSDTVAMKLAAIVLSTVAFCAMTALVFRLGGFGSALIFASLMIFPERSLLKWNVMYWGAHPESALIAGIGAWAWWNGLTSPRHAGAWFIFAGAIFAATIYASAAVFYVVAIVFAFTMILIPGKRRWLEFGALAGGFGVAIAPLAFRLAGGLRERLFEPAVFDNTASVPMTSVVGLPSLDRLERFFAQDWMSTFYATPAEWALTGIAAMFVIAALRSDGATDRARARLIFPASIVTGLVVVSMFPFVTHLHTRHILWLMISGYACVAFFLGGATAPERFYLARPRARTIEAGLKGLIAVAIVGAHVASLSPLIQPRQFGMLGQFRGEEYARHFLGQIVGDEVDRVNALLDARLEEMGDADFVAGMGEIFRMSGVYDCCLWDPVAPNIDDIRQPESADNAMFFQGVGCALALKDGGAFVLARVADRLGEPAASASNEGYARCGMVTGAHRP